MHPLWLATFAAALVALSVSDLQFRKLPNLGTAALLLVGLARAFVAGGLSFAGLALAGAAVGLALLLFQFLRGWMGAGDVKLLCGIGAWVGPMGAVWVFLFGSVVGGILSIVSFLRLDHRERSLVLHNMALFALARGAHLPAPSEISRSRGIPFGVALSIAAIGVAAFSGGQP